MKLKIANFREQKEKDFETGRGFKITTVDAIKLSGERNPNGIFSPFYGTSENNDEIESPFTCKCGSVRGKFYLNKVCPKCNTVVEEDKNILDRTGWIELAEDLCLIHPIMYYHIEKLLGKKYLKNIIKFESLIDENGNIISADENEDDPYVNKGILFFRDHFEEIINSDRVKDDKIHYRDFILENKDKVFINDIPVYSLLLRDILKIKDTVISNDINKKFNGLLGNILVLNKNENGLDRVDLKILPLLYESQEMLMEINKLIEKQVATKEGLIRGNIMGIRLNFSSRCVIVPLLERCKINQIVLPYLSFNVLFQYEIINILSTTMNYFDAYNKWQKSCQEFDPTIYNIMQDLIHKSKGKLNVLLGRNPTLNYGSILLMEIKDVKKDVDDLTMAIPLNILAVLAGDFDGDVLYIISLKDQKMVDTYRIFDPRTMLIDRYNFNFNTRMSLIKDQIIGMYNFNK